MIRLAGFRCAYFGKLERVFNTVYQNHFFGARKGARKMGGNTPFSPPNFLGPKPEVWGDIGPQKLSFKAFFFPPGRKEAGLKSSSLSVCSSFT